MSQNHSSSDEFGDIPDSYRPNDDPVSNPRLNAMKHGFDISHVPLPDEYAQDYIATLEFRGGYADSTINTRTNRLRRIILFFQNGREKELLDAEEHDVEAFVRYYANEKGRCKSYVDKILSSLEFCLKHIERKCNPPNSPSLSPTIVEGIDLDKYSFKDTRDPEPLDRDEIIRMIEVKTGEYPFRNSLIIKLLYKTGIRNKSLRNIKLDDIDHEKQLIHIRKGTKDSGSYHVPIPDGLMLDIETWINTYRKRMLNDRDSEYLFPSKKSGKLQVSSTLQGIVHKQALAADVQEKTDDGWRVFPHLFRHCLTTHIKEDMREDPRKNFDESEIKYFVQIIRGDKDIKSQEDYDHTTQSSHDLDTIREFQQNL